MTATVQLTAPMSPGRKARALASIGVSVESIVRALVQEHGMCSTAARAMANRERRSPVEASQ